MPAQQHGNRRHHPNQHPEQIRLRIPRIALRAQKVGGATAGSQRHPAPRSISSYTALIAIATHTDKNAAMGRRQQAQSGQQAAA